jgi:hypothetical protein
MNRYLLALSLVAVGCGHEQGFAGVDGNAGGDGPAIRVTPAQLDFGTVSAADDAVVQTFTIESVGDVELEVTGIEIVDTAGSFTLVSEGTTFFLPPGATQDIDVAFVPLGANAQVGNAFVSSNDEDDAKVLVELIGQGAVPELAFDPDPLDFGNTYVGCTKDNTLDLVNVGTDVAEVYTLAQTGSAFTLYNTPTLPLTLYPGESVSMNVDFAPDADTSFSGFVVATSSEPAGTRKGEQMGLGKYAAEYTDTWEIPVDPPSDIIFFVDQSCSMDDDQRTLADNFSTFITELNGYTTDWRVMVVNDDDGCNNSGVLSSSSSNYASRFSSAVSAGGGTFTEAGLIVTSRAVDKTDSGECNDNFMRSDAMLHIIMVSDEPEQSPGTWSDYVSAVIAKKGSTANVRMSAIAGPVPGGCSTADPGTGYSDAVNATGGVFLSICSNWSSSSNLQMLAEASVNQDTYELSRTPVENTIEVTVDGVRASDSIWDYDSATNSVVFNSLVPTEGQTVEISYAGSASCD